MAGLVMGNMGQALGNFGTNIGNMMFKSIGDEATLAARKEEWLAKLEDRQQAREDKADLMREITGMKLDAASTKNAGAGGKGNINMEDIKPGGSQEVWAAAKLDMTVPEYTAFYNSLKTGDKSAFLQSVTSEVPAATGMGAYQGQTSDQVSAQKVTEKIVPPGFEDAYKAKMKKLADIQESYALGGHYDDVMKGRQQGFQTETGQAVLAGNMKAGPAGEAVGVSLGKERMKVEGGEKLNVFTGESSTTPKGLSEIQENKAQAGKASSGGGTKAPRVQSTKEDSEGNMILIMSDGTTRPLTGNDGKPMRSAAFNKEVAKTITKMEEESSAFKKLPEEDKRKRAQERLTGKISDAAPAASSTSVATPVTQADFDKLPSGARYINPKDGKTYTKK